MSTKRNKNSPLEPDVFNSSENNNPSKWLRRYELFAKNNEFNEREKIEALEYYLDNKTRIWYENNFDTFTNWKILKEAFINKYMGDEVEFKAWNDLQNAKQGSEDMEEFSNRMEIMFKQAKITDEKIKIKCLMSAVAPYYKRALVKNKVTTYSEAIKTLTEEERLDKVLL
ncbi:hypothetical protein AX774_g4886 [Zancudomyces culisetae]|uniref:Retrotransposon gag domain-containing protein n=1 Tax=Zancudomyces culisetae TaxID=1213189 RepID=A0A1R1PL15_ZANCU|nr:hypothetical protein AX774_g4886 [Zancudomyces culisetae]|eukprot:OMH81655.1 hypothetical protein AX774_g4886 [Zancudomyces culisetae]